MSDSGREEAGREQRTRSLKEALAFARDRVTDRCDAVAEMKAAEQARLSLLADELRPLMMEIDESDERFDFALTNGQRPRLWIDMTSFVTMGGDRQTYRFLKDSRMGRIVLAESKELDRTADFVSEYVAEKIIERERLMEGEWHSLNRGNGVEFDRETPLRKATSTSEKAETHSNSDRSASKTATLPTAAPESADLNRQTKQEEMSARAEPARAEPARAEPTRAELARAEPRRSTSYKSEYKEEAPRPTEATDTAAAMRAKALKSRSTRNAQNGAWWFILGLSFFLVILLLLVFFWAPAAH